MDDVLSWQTLLFTVGIFIFSFFIRRTLEAVFPSLRKDTPDTTGSRIWQMVLLPMLPVAVGMLTAGLVKRWPFPPSIDHLESRVIYGAVCGFFSSWSYRIAKKVVFAQFRVKDENETKESDDSNEPEDKLCRTIGICGLALHSWQVSWLPCCCVETPHLRQGLQQSPRIRVQKQRKNLLQNLLERDKEEIESLSLPGKKPMKKSIIRSLH